MRCGCISMGEVRCSGCHRTIQYLERYLTTEGETEGAALYFCLDCALSRGYAQYRQEKGDQMVTFFTE